MTEYKNTIDIIGVIQNVLELKQTKCGENWTFIKLRIAPPSNQIFTARIKFFGNDISQQVVDKYKQNDIIEVIGEAMLDRYVCRNREYTDFVINPTEIIKLGTKTLQITSVVLK